MQTFLPDPSYVVSAQLLDTMRLVKQRVECLQIMSAIADPTYGWQNHPAVVQWRGFEHALVCYACAVHVECDDRQIADNSRMQERIFYEHPIHAFYRQPDADLGRPPWLGDERLHASHRSNLLRKDPDYYEQHGWDVPDDLEYFWPSKHSDYAHHFQKYGAPMEEPRKPNSMCRECGGEFHSARPDVNSKWYRLCAECLRSNA